MQNNEQNGHPDQPVNWGERRVARPKPISDQGNNSVFNRRYRQLNADDPLNNGGVDRQSNQGVSVQQVGEGGGYQNPNSETATAEDGRNVRRRIEEVQGSPSNFQAVRNNSPISASATPTGAGAGAGGGVSPNGAGAGGVAIPNGAGAGGVAIPNGAGAGGVAGAVTNQGQAPVTPPAHIVALGNDFLNATPGTLRRST